MRTKKIGDRSPLRVPAVSAKKTATLPLLIASLKSKGRLMIAKMGKRKQDDGSYQLLYKQVDDAIFAKIYLSSEGSIVVKDGHIGQRLIHRKYDASDWPKIQAEIEIGKAKGYVHLASMKWMSWTYCCQPFPFPWKMLNLFAWNCPNFWSTLRLGFLEGSMKTMKQ